MFDLTAKDMRAVLDSFGIEKDAVIITHSSLKSPGATEGGPDGVIKALFDTVPEGTVVFPTLSQKNWDTVYQDWSLDRPSDVGLISETFRVKYATHRSDNPTHSVAAKGKFAEDLTNGHALPPKRFCIFGDYCFCENSPWQRLFDSRTRYGVKSYVLFWGVDMTYNTLKHFSEARFIEYVLNMIKEEKNREEVKSKLSHYPFDPDSPDYLSISYSSKNFMQTLEEEGILKRAKIGKSEVIACDVYDSVSRVDRALRETPEKMLSQKALDWLNYAKRFM